MSDDTLTGVSGNPPRQVKQESHDHGAAPSNTLQSEAAVANSIGGGSHVTTSGNVVNSSDPSTRPDATIGQKLKGDVQGAVQGTIGSMQAATGTMLRNKDMEQKGLDKMQEEDHRLAAKRGVLPVGSDQRNTVADANTSGVNVPK